MQEFAYSPISLLILIVNIVMSLLAFQRQELLHRWLLHPYEMSRQNSWYRLITSGFIHGDMFHLAFNMITFYSFAVGYGRLENIMGSVTFGLFYFFSLIISDLTTVVRHKDNYVYRALGASGAVSAVILAMIMYEPSGYLYFFGLDSLAIPSWLFAVGYIGYSYYASTRNIGGNIGHEAHLWGAIAGVFLGYIMSPVIRERFQIWVMDLLP